MKKCYFCGHEIEDDADFCTECGNELPDSTCPQCGADVDDNDNYCQNCGYDLANDEGVVVEEDSGNGGGIDGMVEEEPLTPNTFKFLVIGIILALLLGGGWYGYKEYSACNEKKLAREKLIADSLEQVRKDSIKLAEQKEQERIEAEKIAEFHKKLSFENFLGMLNHYDKESYANKCGLSFLYKDVSEEGFIEIVYGYDVEKGAKKEPNIKIKSCLLLYLHSRYINICSVIIPR